MNIALRQYGLSARQWAIDFFCCLSNNSLTKHVAYAVVLTAFSIALNGCQPSYGQAVSSSPKQVHPQDTIDQDGVETELKSDHSSRTITTFSSDDKNINSDSRFSKPWWSLDPTYLLYDSTRQNGLIYDRLPHDPILQNMKRRMGSSKANMDSDGV